MSGGGRWLILGALAIMGAGVLWRSLPETDPVLRASVTVDRGQLIEQTKDYGHRWNCPVTAGTELVTARHNPAFDWWRKFSAGADSTQWPQSLFRVEVQGPNGELSALYTARGELQRFDCRPTGPPTPGQPASAAVVDQVFRALSASVPGTFEPAVASTGEHNVPHYTANLQKNPPGAAWTIEADVSGTAVRHAELAYLLADDVTTAHRAAAARVTNPTVLGNFLNYLLLLAAPIGAIVMLVRKRLNTRLTLVLAVAFALLSVPIEFRAENVADASSHLPRVVMQMFVLLGIVIQLLLWVGAIVLGEVFSRRWECRRWHALRCLGTGTFWLRPIGTSLLAGSLGAVALAAVTTVVVISAISPDLVLSISSRSRLVLPSATPAWFAVLPSATDLSISVFGLLMPWLSGRGRFYGAAGILAAFAIFLSGAGVVTGVAASVAWAAASLAISYFVFHQFGVLSVFFASLGSDSLIQCLRLWHSPAASLHQSGLRGLLTLGVVALFGLLVHLKGKDAGAETTDTGAVEATPASARELLKSEFSLAHRAQQQMLPSQPPSVPGFSLAGLCHPARDVGGDLYDYVRLADGRLGICVADVSGKGMPAALYMTYTKGLLAAAVQDSGNIVEIAKQLNGHLYAAGRRKVFVTAVLGVVDPARRQFEYVRAGHNPLVWRKAAARETVLLQSPGMGFGVGASRYFDRSLRAEELTLSAGDALVFYSDGLTEAMNAELEQFGEERLMECVSQADGMDADSTRDLIHSTVRQFLDGVPAQDDMTIVVLRVKEI